MTTPRKRLSEYPLEERLKLMGLGKPITPEELERREEWSKRVDETAKKIGKIDMSVHDLLHMTDEELDEKYGRTPPNSNGSSETHD